MSSLYHLVIRTCGRDVTECNEHVARFFDKAISSSSALRTRNLPSPAEIGTIDGIVVNSVLWDMHSFYELIYIDNLVPRLRELLYQEWQLALGLQVVVVAPRV